MLNFFKGTNTYQLIVWGIIVAGTIFSIFPPDALFFKIGAKFAVQIMFTYLALSFVFLFVGDEKTMFISLGCCAILCLFLRTSAATAFPPKLANEDSYLSMATFNLSNSNDDFDSTFNMILSSNADLIALQEVNPDWYNYIKSNPYIQKYYPHDTSIVRMDFLGMTILSKYKFLKIDTFHYDYIPNLIGCIQHDKLDEKIYFISSHTTPPVSLKAYESIRKHLGQVADTVNTINDPIFALGDYQVVSWSNEILSFRQKAGLEDSRRDVPTSYFPHDHIFFSKQFECLELLSIGSQNTVHLGIVGKYQRKKNEKIITGEIE